MTLDLFATDYIRWVVLLIVIDWVLGVAAALAKGEFKLHLVAHYMHDAVLPFILVFAVVEAVGMAQPSLSWIVPVTFVLIVVNLVGNIIGNVGKMGLNLPRWLEKSK